MRIHTHLGQHFTSIAWEPHAGDGLCLSPGSLTYSD